MGVVVEKLSKEKGGDSYGVTVRKKVKGSGVWWVFVSHRGKRTITLHMSRNNWDIIRFRSP